MTFIDWLQNLISKGLGVAAHRYYGIYRATVTDSQDPESRGRVKLVCPQVGQSDPIDRWVQPAFYGAGPSRGFFWGPEKNDTVWVSFYEGDPSLPEVYFGGWYGKTEQGTAETSEALRKATERKGFVTRAGHTLMFDDTKGEERLTIFINYPDSSDPAVSDRTLTAKPNPEKNTVISVDKNGSFLLKTPSSYIFSVDEDKKEVTLAAPSGSMYTIGSDDSLAMVHKGGQSISIGGSTIDISGTAAMDINISGKNVVLNGGGVALGSKALDFGVLGLKLVAWLAKHTHPHALGITLPPVLDLPDLPTILSKSVKIQE